MEPFEEITPCEPDVVPVTGTASYVVAVIRGHGLGSQHEEGADQTSTPSC